MSRDTVTWVIPCFNEAARIDRSAFLALADQAPSTSLVFVDDGSRDQTLPCLNEIAGQRPDRITVVAQTENQGKAEAVRQGLLRALADEADVVGFVDADLATPPVELLRLAEMVRGGSYDIVIASRVQLLGHDIHRRPMRHYLGRVFATCASLALGLAVYDTQCGAKVFRRSEALQAAIAHPFRSHWAFDVELLGRLIHPGAGAAAIPVERIREESLRVWRDVPGSKLGPAAAVQAGLELVRIGLDLRRR
jgi:glycosyltransferase involved in cell wall biosynthesis